MSDLASWSRAGHRYHVEDLGTWFRLSCDDGRAMQDTIGDAGRAEWLVLTDRERTAWAEQLLAEAAHN